MARGTVRWGAALVVTLAPATGRAADSLELMEVRVDRPTLHALGVQVLIAGDDDRDATIEVRVREQGGSWRAGPPLLRVWPETIAATVPQQFAGSVFDLVPATTYEIELHVVDPDGPVDTTQSVTATTRPVPADPANPTEVPVADVAGLQAALQAAVPGAVIVLAPGTYAGSSFMLTASGTPEDPIVIRGQSQADVVIDGQGCGGCNVLEVYGSHVHIEDLTIRAGERAIRFQGADTTGNVVRRVVITDVVHGIGSKPGQSDFYLCDNDITGRLVWPWTFDADAGAHWDDRGIEVTGDGHVICHNRLRGFGDPVLNMQELSRAWDVVGNDIFDTYDGTELDRSAGNARLYLNRFTNVMNPASVQPSQGGPVYVLRNVVFNAPEEQVKLKSVGGVEEPSGVIVAHNTFVSPSRALNLQAPITQHNSVLLNNLCIGPEQLAGARTVDWTARLNGVTFDGNGYYPDGGFWFGVVDDVNQVFPDFAAVLASGTVEPGGRLLARPIFAADFVGPADPKAHQEAADFALDPGSAAVDAALELPGLNDASPGGPDIGARELGCAAPTYGPRPKALEGKIAAVNCAQDEPGETTGDPTGDPTGGPTGGPGETSNGVPTTGGPEDTAGTGQPPTSSGSDTTGSGGATETDDGPAGDGEGGCGCTHTAPTPASWLALLLLGLRRRPRPARRR